MSFVTYLRLINHSNDSNNDEVVIFQGNVSEDLRELHIAWQVIRNLGVGDSHPFTYPIASTVAASDSFGNTTTPMDASPGAAFEMIRKRSGDVLEYAGQSTNPDEIEVRNNLERGAISALVFKSGKLLLSQTGIVPLQKAVFEIEPIISVGVASQVVEGVSVSSAVLSQVNTQFDLMGVKSAGIIMTGGNWCECDAV